MYSAKIVPLSPIFTDLTSPRVRERVYACLSEML